MKWSVLILDNISYPYRKNRNMGFHKTGIFFFYQKSEKMIHPIVSIVDSII